MNDITLGFLIYLIGAILAFSIHKYRSRFQINDWYQIRDRLAATILSWIAILIFMIVEIVKFILNIEIKLKKIKPPKWL